MSGTVDDSSLAPTSSSMTMRRGMETAFLMIYKPSFDHCSCVCVRVCFSKSGDVSCKIVVVRCWYDYQEDEKSVCASYV